MPTYRIGSKLIFIGLGVALGCHSGSAAPPASNAASDELAASAPAAAAPNPSPAAASVATAPSAATSKPAPAGAKRVRAFFSGHSLLDNPMPDWVELIAQSRGDSLGWQEQIVLGSPIRVRTKGDDPNASGFVGYKLGKSKSGLSIDVIGELQSPHSLVQGEKYERLLITERSDLLGALKWEDTIGYLRHFHDRLIEYSGENAATLLYQCWPAIDKDDPTEWLAYVRQELLAWECAAAKVNHTLQADGRRDRVAVVPGGIALTTLVERALAGQVSGLIGSPRQRLDAIFSDDAHLTALGTYLLSAVHYSALFGKSPVGGAGPREVPAELAAVLQQLAWDTVSHYSAATRAPKLSECRARIARELCPAYYRRRGKPDDVASCGFWASSESPFADSAATPSAE